LSQNGRVCGRGLSPEVGLLSPGQNGAGNVWLATSVYVMEGCGTVTAGHGALQLHAYLVHCIAYAGPLTWSPQLRQTTRGAVIHGTPDCV